MKTSKSLFFIFLLMFSTAFVSCDDEVINSNPVNDWIYESMDTYYLWNNYLPDPRNPALPPEEYFESLLHDEDRFSSIHPNAQELSDQLNGIVEGTGMSVAIFTNQYDHFVKAMILYVLPGGPAEEAGLKRGDIINEINRAHLNLSNFEKLLFDTFGTLSVRYSRYDPQFETYISQQAVDVTTRSTAENPNHFSTVYEFENDVVGYYMYNFFSPGLQGNDNYDQEMDAVFAEFKSRGVKNLILDFRYNSGGSLQSALNLASHIAPGVSTEDLFFYLVWNPEIHKMIENEPDGKQSLKAYFLPKENYIGDQLEKIYILTSPSTASASELIIHGLSPYININLIGQQTVGKHVGSILINEPDNPENPYALFPVSFRIFNSLNDSDFSAGFIPEEMALVNEFNYLPLSPIGDVTDPMINLSLHFLGHMNWLSYEYRGRTDGKIEKRSMGNPVETSNERRPFSGRSYFPALN